MSLLRSNLLNHAHKIIPFERVTFEHWMWNDTVNGEDVPVYGAGIDLEASVQRIRAELYPKLGLSLQKDYRWVFASIKMSGTDEQEVPDRIFYNNSYWNAVKSNNWSVYDGWSGAVFVRVKQSDVQE